MPGDAYDFWLLDLDGTVVDVEPRYVHRVMGRVGDRLGADFDATEAERLWYEDAGERAAVLDAHGIAPERFWATFHDVEDPASRAAATYLYDDAAAVVPSLDGPVGLVTHCQPDLTSPILARLDIGDWFDAVVCCGDDVGWKPDPDPVEAAVDRLGVDGASSRGVLAGDAPSDVHAARNAGLDAVHVDRGRRGPRSSVPAGHRRIETLDTLVGP